MIFVCDLDGTIADNSFRQKFIDVPKGEKKDWDKFYNEDLMRKDPAFPAAQGFFVRMNHRMPSSHIVFLTGRPERTREVTAAWINQHFNLVAVPEDRGEFLRGPPNALVAQLLMRSDNDFRPANIYKRTKLALMAMWRPNEPFVIVDDDERCYEDFWRYGLVFRPPAAWAAIIT